MHTTGKTLGESPTYSNIIHLRCASNGRRVTLSVNTKKDAKFKSIVDAIMDGKSKFSTQWSTRQSSVTMLRKSTPTKNYSNARRIFSAGTITLVRTVARTNRCPRWFQRKCNYSNKRQSTRRTHTTQS